MHKLKQFWERLPIWARSKYFIAGFGFLIWMLFLDTNSVLTQLELSREIKDLDQAKTHYEAEVEKDLEALKKLDGSDASLEKFAREQYRMRRDNEDVFIIQAEQD